jgi:hypothetical protein
VFERPFSLLLFLLFTFSVRFFNFMVCFSNFFYDLVLARFFSFLSFWPGTPYRSIYYLVGSLLR